MSDDWNWMKMESIGMSDKTFWFVLIIGLAVILTAFALLAATS